MILSAIIGISIVSYIKLSRTALALSNRSIYSNAAVNLAEQGLEEAMYSINQLVANPSYNWNGWNNHSVAGKRRKWENIPLSQNATGEFRVYVLNYTGTPAPRVFSRALIRLGGSSETPIEKWLEVQLAKTSKFSNGLVAKNSIIFSGNNATVDSWNSDPENDGLGIRPFSESLRNDNGTVGSISISTDAVVTSNADVWGFVSTGATDPTAFVGNNGSILGANSVNDGTWTANNVDPNRVSTNFAATFDPVTAPTNTSNGLLGDLNSTTELPRPSDLPSGGVYYYDATRINLAGTDQLTISDNVVLRVSGPISTTGQAAISISGSGSLAIYTANDVNLGGTGVANGTDGNGDGQLQASELGQAVKFQLWGTSTTSQQINIVGSSQFSGVVYAPQGNVRIVGNGAVCGSVVANNIDLSGNAQFHYDEALANFGGGNPFRVARWRELILASERSVPAPLLNW